MLSEWEKHLHPSAEPRDIPSVPVATGHPLGAGAGPVGAMGVRCRVGEDVDEVVTLTEVWAVVLAYLEAVPLEGPGDIFQVLGAHVPVAAVPQK